MSEAKDIVQRLRRFSLARSGELRPNPDAVLVDEAADEIDRLSVDKAELIAALKALAVYYPDIWVPKKPRRARPLPRRGM